MTATVRFEKNKPINDFKAFVYLISLRDFHWSGDKLWEDMLTYPLIVLIVILKFKHLPVMHLFHFMSSYIKQIVYFNYISVVIHTIISSFTGIFRLTFGGPYVITFEELLVFIVTKYRLNSVCGALKYAITTQFD